MADIIKHAILPPGSIHICNNFGFDNENIRQLQQVTVDDVCKLGYQYDTQSLWLLTGVQPGGTGIWKAIQTGDAIPISSTTTAGIIKMPVDGPFTADSNGVLGFNTEFQTMIDTIPVDGIDNTTVDDSGAHAIGYDGHTIGNITLPSGNVANTLDALASEINSIYSTLISSSGSNLITFPGYAANGITISADTLTNVLEQMIDTFSVARYS